MRFYGYFRTKKTPSASCRLPETICAFPNPMEPEHPQLLQLLPDRPSAWGLEGRRQTSARHSKAPSAKAQPQSLQLRRLSSTNLKSQGPPMAELRRDHRQSSDPRPRFTVALIAAASFLNRGGLSLPHSHKVPSFTVLGPALKGLPPRFV